MKNKAKNESKLKELDERILRYLRESKGSLIDDTDLIESLTDCKNTGDEVAR